MRKGNCEKGYSGHSRLFKVTMIDWLPNDILWDATTIFKRVLYIVWIKIRHLKGENKLVSSGRLDSNGLEI